MTSHWGEIPFTGASDAGQMEYGPDADALSVLQRVRDGLLGETADSSDGEEQVA